MRQFPHLGISETPLLTKMDDDADNQLGFQVQPGNGETMLNCPSSGSGMHTNPLSEKVIAMSSGGGGGGSSFYGSVGGGWDPMASISSHAENFGCGSSMVTHGDFATCSYPLMLENQRMGGANNSHLVHYSSDPSFSGMVPKLPIYGSGNYSEMVNSFGLRGCVGGSNANYDISRSGGFEKVTLDASLGQGNCKIDRVAGVSPNGKRTRGSSGSPSPLNSNKDPEADRHRENTVETSEPKELEEKKQKTEQNQGGNSGAKQNGKQAEEGSQSGEDPKQNYIHVRARRGQATNSHSLAERVRREKISERMRLLQELVPGCNKITGKAVMLDEIINYVQSLQQQVEFLSMKLATVNPEMNFDIERILSKDILNSRGGGTSILGFNPGMISSHPFTSGIHPGSLPTIQNASSQQYHPVPQAMWDTDLHNLLQMGFDSNTPAASNLGPNGSSKMEL